MIRPRTVWEDPAEPVIGPAASPALVDRIPLHYTGASVVGADTAPMLRAIQHDYTVNRGYSVGYNFACDRHGVAWELRGLDIRCAANRGFNDSTFAILCLVDGANPASPLMVDAVRVIVAHIRTHLGRTVPVVGHRDVGATACPGDGIYTQIGAGVFEPRPNPQPVPDPQPQPEDDPTMLTTLFTFRGYVYACWSNGTKTLLPTTASVDMFKGLRAMAGLATPHQVLADGPADNVTLMVAAGPVVGPTGGARDSWGA